MPVFKNLVDLFSNLSPRRRRQTEDQRSTVQRAERLPSTPPRSRAVGSGRDSFFLGSDTNLTEILSPRNAGSDPLSTVCISYLHARVPPIFALGRPYRLLIARPYNLPTLRTIALSSA
jgi:hypothetical protein